MANALTGDFDVVAEFAMPAANRVLATLHRGERVPHSVSVRVDAPQPAGHPIPRARGERQFTRGRDRESSADRTGTRCGAPPPWPASACPSLTRS